MGVLKITEVLHTSAEIVCHRGKSHLRCGEDADHKTQLHRSLAYTIATGITARCDQSCQASARRSTGKEERCIQARNGATHRVSAGQRLWCGAVQWNIKRQV